MDPEKNFRKDTSKNNKNDNTFEKKNYFKNYFNVLVKYHNIKFRVI